MSQLAPQTALLNDAEFHPNAETQAMPVPTAAPVEILIPEPGSLAAVNAQLALETFALYLQEETFDFEINMLGINRLRFLKRRRFRDEFVAVALGLWRLALERSFPAHWRYIFETFLAGHLDAIPDDARAAALESKVRFYVNLLEQKRESDFTGVGGHIVDLMRYPESCSTPLRLRLTLHIRSLYTSIYNHLI